MPSDVKLQVLKMLRENARLGTDQIARRLNVPEDVIVSVIADLEKTKAIVAYKAIVNPEVVDNGQVDAIIEVGVAPRRGHGFDEIARRIGGFPEVRSLYLMSGGTDFLVFLEAQSIKEIARFVTEKLATLDNVNSTTTHFILKEYKKDGTMLNVPEPIERLAVAP